MWGLREGAGRGAGGKASVGLRGDLEERFHHPVLRVGQKRLKGGRGHLATVLRG